VVPFSLSFHHWNPPPIFPTHFGESLPARFAVWLLLNYFALSSPLPSRGHRPRKVHSKRVCHLCVCSFRILTETFIVIRRFRIPPRPRSEKFPLSRRLHSPLCSSLLFLLPTLLASRCIQPKPSLLSSPWSTLPSVPLAGNSWFLFFFDEL